MTRTNYQTYLLYETSYEGDGYRFLDRLDLDTEYSLQSGEILVYLSSPPSDCNSQSPSETNGRLSGFKITSILLPIIGKQDAMCADRSRMCRRGTGFWHRDLAVDFPSQSEGNLARVVLLERLSIDVSLEDILIRT